MDELVGERGRGGGESEGGVAGACWGEEVSSRCSILIRTRRWFTSDSDCALSLGQC